MDIHALDPGHIVCLSTGQRKGALAGMFRSGIEGYKVPGIGLSFEQKGRPLPVAKALYLSEIALYDLQVMVHYGRGLSYTFSLLLRSVVFRIFFQFIDPGLQYRVNKRFIIHHLDPRLEIDFGG